MTTSLQSIAQIFRTTNMVLSLSLSDLTDKDVRARVRNGAGPSIAWEVGHMLHYRYQVMELLGVENDNRYRAKYSDAPASDGSDYPDTPEYRQVWNQIAAKLEAALEMATEETLLRSVGNGEHGEKSALDSIMFLAWHEAYHVGAIGGIRKALGYPGPAELVLARQDKSAASDDAIKGKAATAQYAGV